MDDKPIALAERLELATEQWNHEKADVDSNLFQVISATTMIAQQIQIDFRELALEIGYELGVGELRILFVLRRSGPDYSLRAVDLGHYLLITSGAITKQISRLKSKGLIIRARSTTRRGWTLKLTDKGREVAENALRLSVLPATASAFGTLTLEEQTEGVRFLRKLLGRMERTRGRDLKSDLVLP
jgi:DNA-binding MarR family transcriptional regulator